MLSPAVSVIMLTYNREKYVRESIGSLLAQTYANFELIIIDDGSTDGTIDILRSFTDERISVYFLEHTRYGSKMRNFGISKSRGDLIAFLDSDDLWMPQKLEVQIEQMTKNPSLGFTVSEVIEFSDEGGVLKNSIYNDHGKAYFAGNIFNQYVNNDLVIYPSTVLFRRSCLDLLGPWNEDYHWTDNEFLHRLSYHFEAWISYEPLAQIRKHDQNHSTLYLHDTIIEMVPMIHSLLLRKMITVRVYKKMTAYYHYMNGVLYWREKRYPDAEKAFRTCLAVQPLHWKAFVRWITCKLHGSP